MSRLAYAVFAVPVVLVVVLVAFTFCVCDLIPPPEIGPRRVFDSEFITIRAGVLNELTNERDALREAHEAEVYYSPSVGAYPPPLNAMTVAGDVELTVETRYICVECESVAIYDQIEAKRIRCECGSNTFRHVVTIEIPLAPTDEEPES